MRLRVIIYLTILLLLVNCQPKTGSANTDHDGSLPSPPQLDFSKHPDLHVLHVDLTSDDKLKVDGKEMSLDAASVKVEKLILTKGKNLAFSVTSKRSTSHLLFTKVVDGLIAGNYNRIRDDYSLRNYQKTFLELDEELQKEVKMTYPLVISIAPPTP
jgi:hypothetical protein